MGTGEEVAAIVWATGIAERRLAGRTVRSLREAGYEALVTDDASRLRGPLLVARAGSWLRQRQKLRIPRRPGLIALGSSGSGEWLTLLRKCGGDLSLLRRQWRRRRLPFTPVFFVEVAEAMAALMVTGRSIDHALSELAFSGTLRVVRLPALDAAHSPALRVLQVVTTIQTGGAEHVTLDLAAELNQQGIATAMAALGRPASRAFPTPPHLVSLADTPGTSEARAEAIAECALEWGADVVHAHLLTDADTRAVKARGLPLAVTVHNARPGWPAGLEDTNTESADIIFACAQSVAGQLRDISGPPVRTLLNGIVPAAFASTPERRAAGSALRKNLGIPEGAPVLLSLANPRPQKRLELLPPVLALLPGVHLLMAGDPGAGREQALEPVRVAISSARVAERVHWLGLPEDVPAVLAASDALISLSGWEGLSLAYLEALAAGKPVIATDAGGTREIAARHAAMTLLPLDATAETTAETVRNVLANPMTAPFPRCFTRYHMARRAARMYRRILAPEVSQARDVRRIWLITNNFSAGGAQSSARRLLTELSQDRGLDVRAAVVQENPRRPTPGRRALEAAGIKVTALPPPETCDAAEACALLLDAMDAAPPDAVVFWNLITSYKVILADALMHSRVIDVSPGGMYYTSADKYFQEPRPDFPYHSPQEYGALLAGMVVKYEREAAQAGDYLGTEVTVIPNGVHLPPQVRRQRGKDEPIVFATAARLSPDKCLHELIAALKLAAPHLPPWKLRVAGGPERDHKGYDRILQRMARGLPVEWCGMLPDTQMFLQNADIFVMISEPPGCPNALLEALAARLPVIATDVGGAGEQVLNEMSGLLVPPADAAALSAAMVRLARDETLRRDLGERGGRHVADNFSLEKMASRFRKLLRG
jgi:glycosyltransferase involved in cell wall biosynthesis